MLSMSVEEEAEAEAESASAKRKGVELWFTTQVRAHSTCPWCTATARELLHSHKAPSHCTTDH
jgi:hypothetical protein